MIPATAFLIFHSGIAAANPLTGDAGFLMAALLFVAAAASLLILRKRR
ncbi:MAG: hypothetical protein ACOYKJ_07765 [Candidatus Howiella sp.]|jgi:hypothetical protein